MEQAIAVGDGTNGVPMLYAARLSIVFDPPRVRAAVPTSVDGGDLRAILPTVASYLDGNRNHT